MALEYNEWIELAYQKGHILKWNDLKNMTKGKTVKLAVSLSQGNSIKENKVYDPVDFFKSHKQIYIHQGVVGDFSKGILNGEKYSELFYEYEGEAVLGSGADISMKWKYLKKMPKIYYSD